MELVRVPFEVTGTRPNACPDDDAPREGGRRISIHCEVRGEDEPVLVRAVDLERGDVVFDGPLDGFRYFARVLQAQ